MDYKTHANKRNLMNKIRKGDIVIHKNLEGQTFIAEYFDYTGLLIGLRRIHTNNSKEPKILWANPEFVIQTGLSTDRYSEEMPDKVYEYCKNDVEITKSVYNTVSSSRMNIKNVIFSNPATIVFWSDGSKTVVKSHLDDYDPEKGLAMAIAKKALGNEGNYYNVFKKWLPKEDSSKETRDRILNEISEKCVNEIIERKLEAFRSHFENGESIN